MIKLTISKTEIPFDLINFSDGTSNLTLKVPEHFLKSPYYLTSCDVVITLDTGTNPNDQLWQLLLLNDALRQTFNLCRPRKKTLIVPYLYHARADRTFDKGQGVPLRVFMSLLRSLDFDQIRIKDPHSKEYKHLEFYEGVAFEETPQHLLFRNTCLHSFEGDKDILISPDKGALAKVKILVKSIRLSQNVTLDVITATKKRNKDNGRIMETHLPDVDLTGKDCWIVDDILDGGGTFIPLGKALKDKGADKVNLYITHGIFAKGLDLLKGSIDNIYCHQIIGSYVTISDIEKFNRGE